jgi:hypothetical protein
MEDQECQGENGGQHDGVDDSDDQSLGEWGELDQLGLECIENH